MKSKVKKRLVLAAIASAGLLGVTSYTTFKCSPVPLLQPTTTEDDYVNLPTTTADLTKDILIPEGVGSSNDAPINYSHWVLLSILKSKNVKRRNRAIDELACQRRWNDAECRVIAQALDPDNAIRLARTHDCDTRLLLPPPSLNFLELTLKSGKIDKLIKTILQDVSLSLDDCSSCANFYTNMSIRNRPDSSLFAISDLEQMDKIINLKSRKKKKSMLDDDVIKLKAILTNVMCGEKQAIPMIKSGLLTGLHYFRYRYVDEPQINSLLSQILASISIHESLRPFLHTNGWIRIITEYSRDSHLEISLPAHKTLANLDPDRKSGERYGELLYLLSPLHRVEPEPKFDVIFIHGLIGSVYKSWSQSRTKQIAAGPTNDSKQGPSDTKNTNIVQQQAEEIKVSTDNDAPTRCWPKDWLAEDVRSLRILAMDYPTALSKWRTECDQSKETLKERAEHVINQLVNARVGARPIIWVAHSMGGLMIKQILLTCSQATDDTTLDEETVQIRRDILDQTKGIVFFSVPHKGSNLEWIERKNLQKLLLLTTEVIELQKGSPILMELHENFMKMIKEKKSTIKFLSFAESCIESKFGVHPMVTWKGVLVHEDSLQFDFGPFHKLSIDHAHTCKPHNKEAFTYVNTLKFITDIILEHSKRNDEHLIPLLSFPFS